MKTLRKDSSGRARVLALLVPGLLVLALFAAACGPAATSAVSTGEAETALPGETSAVSTPLATTEATTGATSAATTAATAAATTAATSAATTAATSAATGSPQPAATLAPTSAVQSTAGPAQTTMPTAGTPAAQQVDVQATNLIGMSLVDATGKVLGQIPDVLVDQTGQVQFIVVELPAVGNSPARTVVLDWAKIRTIIKDANLSDVQLQFNGTAQDLQDALALDLQQLPNSIVINTQGTQLPAELNNLFRLAQLNSLNLQAVQNQVNLGQLQDALVDLQQGKVDFVVLDLSSVLGTSTTIMVPWGSLTVDPKLTPNGQALQLDVTPQTLANAPTIDLSQLPTFIDPSKLNWNTITNFWKNLG